MLACFFSAISLKMFSHAIFEVVFPTQYFDLAQAINSQTPISVTETSQDIRPFQSREMFSSPRGRKRERKESASASSRTTPEARISVQPAQQKQWLQALRSRSASTASIRYAHKWAACTHHRQSMSGVGNGPPDLPGSPRRSST